MDTMAQIPRDWSRYLRLSTASALTLSRSDLVLGPREKGGMADLAVEQLSLADPSHGFRVLHLSALRGNRAGQD